uniref:Uncharacterized protein n=1 Tax=Anguilla anguilla TaxID=7936 RepID=A0A0E9W9W2_ANGAN
MISHHIIKLLINFFIFLFCVGGEDIGGVGIRAITASVLLLV